MRAVIQRVASASIIIDGEAGGCFEKGMVILLGVERDDQAADLDWLVKKCVELRIFEDSEGKMNQSLIDTGGSALIVSQFTLFGNVKKGNRPSFNRSAVPEHAIPMYENFVRSVAAVIGSERVLTGRFAADMQVTLTNDGPVTIVLDSRQKDF
jgi:D-aminoacyl-tRNA deacylase